MVYRDGKFGKFLACSNYPSCKNTQNIEEKHLPNDIGVCPKCGSGLVEKRSKKGKIFYGCSNYPNCDFASWDMPTNEMCPNCNQPLYKHTTSRSVNIYCNNKECKYVKPKDEN